MSPAGRLVQRSTRSQVRPRVREAGQLTRRLGRPPSLSSQEVLPALPPESSSRGAVVRLTLARILVRTRRGARNRRLLVRFPFRLGTSCCVASHQSFCVGINAGLFFGPIKECVRT